MDGLEKILLLDCGLGYTDSTGSFHPGNERSNKVENALLGAGYDVVRCRTFDDLEQYVTLEGHTFEEYREAVHVYEETLASYTAPDRSKDPSLKSAYLAAYEKVTRIQEGIRFKTDGLYAIVGHISDMCMDLSDDHLGMLHAVKNYPSDTSTRLIGYTGGSFVHSRKWSPNITQFGRFVGRTEDGEDQIGELLALIAEKEYTPRIVGRDLDLDDE